MFAVVRHPDIDALGIIPAGALDAHRARGWYRVSPWAGQPDDLHVPDFAEVREDLDTVAPEPQETHDESPAEPARDDEEQEV